MQNDDFFKLLDLEKINNFIEEKSNKKLRALIFVTGLILGTIVPKIEIDFNFLSKETLFGLVLGLIWATYRYKQQGEKGILRAQSELGLVFVYLVHFIVGGIIGYYILRPVIF